MGVSREHLGLLVFAVLVEVGDRLLHNILGRCRVVGAEQERAAAVLVTVEHRQQRMRVVGVVGVHRRVGCGPDGHRGVGREADEDHRGREQQDVQHGRQGVAALRDKQNGQQRDGRHASVIGDAEQHAQHDAALAVGLPRSPAHPDDQRQGEEHHARVGGQPERIDEQRVDLCADPYRVGDDDVVHEQQGGAGDECRVDHALEGHLLGLAEVVDEGQRRDGEQVEDVHADREAHQVGDQHDPARGVGLVGLLLPFEHEPHDQCREHRREGVDLALDGREPEGVGEGVGQGADGSGSEHGPRPGVGQLRTAAGHQTPRQGRDGPEEEEDAEGAGQRVHGIDGHADQVRVAESEERGQACQHHEQRGPGRVPHFEFVGGGDEFRAVPEARNRFHRHQVDGCGNGEDRPADDVVPAFEECHVVRIDVVLIADLSCKCSD